MNTFYLIRHGQKESHLGDKPLTQVGIKQAELTANFLKDKKIAAIYASLTKRTTQTAKVIAKILKLDIKIDNRLIERMNWDEDKKETWEEFSKEWFKTDMDRDYVSNRGSSARECGKRVEAVLKEADKLFGNKNILIVSHGGAIGDLLRNNFDEKDLPLIKHTLSPAKYIKILECSITIVKLNNDKLELVQIGDTNHISVSIN